MPAQRFRRRTAGVVASIALSALFVHVGALPANAASAPSNYSSGWMSKPGALSVTAKTTGVLGGIVGALVQPALDSLIGPLVSGLNKLPAAIVTPLLAAVFGDGMTASTPSSSSTTVTSPAVLGGTYTCASGSGTCYSSAGIDASSALLQLKLGLVQGSTERVAIPGGTKLVSQSRVAGVEIGGLLGLIDVLKVGTVTSTSECSAAAGFTPRGSSSVAGVQLLGVTGGVPVISLDVATTGSTSVLTARIAGGSPLTVGTVIDLSSLGLGLQGTVRLDGGLLKVAVKLSLTSVLTSLGLGALTPLVANLVGLSATLNLTVGGAVTPSSGTVEGWGLAVQAGLDLDASLDVLGLIGVNVSTGAPSVNNVLDLRLGYTNCSATGGAVVPDIWISPGLT